MSFTYDPILVLVSVLVAIAGAYACFDLVIRVQRTTGPKRRFWLALAALAIGGSIWAMHFIAMLAVKLPSVMQYDILVTLVSGLVSILMTAVALALVSSTDITSTRICVGGAVMGAGITAMHYVGMSGMRGHFSISYDTAWLIISILVGVFASTLSLWLVMGLQLRGVRRRLLSAIVMGLSIAGVHYSGMFGTTFEAVTHSVALTQPILSAFSMGLITALVTFGILAWSVLMLLPDGSIKSSAASTLTATDSETANDSGRHLSTGDTVLQGTSANIGDITQRSNTAKEQSTTGHSVRAVESSQNTIKPTETPDTEAKMAVSEQAERIPIQRNKKTYFIESNDITSISADGHYTSLRTQDGQVHFCNTSFNKLLNNYDLPDFFRVHRSHAVNINHVVSFQRKRDNAAVSLGTDEHEVPVSRSHVAALQDALGLAK